jgi:hypothetical protein
MNYSDVWLRSAAEQFRGAEALNVGAPRRVYLDKHCEIFCLVSPEDYEFARWGLKRAIRLGEIGCVGGGGDDAERIATPAPFRDLLLSIARTALPLAEAAE